MLYGCVQERHETWLAQCRDGALVPAPRVHRHHRYFGVLVPTTAIKQFPG
jgi:hypothetical protein